MYYFSFMNRTHRGLLLRGQNGLANNLVLAKMFANHAARAD